MKRKKSKAEIRRLYAIARENEENHQYRMDQEEQRARAWAMENAEMFDTESGNQQLNIVNRCDHQKREQEMYDNLWHSHMKQNWAEYDYVEDEQHNKRW